jgi:hypothetical protein
MAYSDFTLDQVVDRFGLEVKVERLAENLQSVEAPAWLVPQLSRGKAWPLVSEKARSETIVVPVLQAVQELVGFDCSVYSGTSLNVDSTLGLAGGCDFIVARTRPLPIVRAPLLMIVEAKRGDLVLALGPCAAQVYAARRFNQTHGFPDRPMFGCVTTGELWQFLRLEGNTLEIDRQPLPLELLNRLLGVLLHILREVAPR